MARRSGNFLAMLFGSISATKKTTSVVRIVLSVTTDSYHGNQCREEQMTQVCADQQRADCPVKVVENIQGLFRSGFIAFDRGFNPVA